MIRVYFDWNIISSLKNYGDVKEPYRSIKSLITRHKENIIVPYSHAHLNDLKRSYYSSEKARELTLSDIDFLEEISLNHGLYQGFHDASVTPIIQRPITVFNTLIKDEDVVETDFESIFDDFGDSELKKLTYQLKKLLQTTSSEIDLKQIDDLPDTYNDFKSLFKYSREDSNFYNLLKDISAVLTDKQKNASVYKSSRNATLDDLKIDTNPQNWGDPFKYLDKILSKANTAKTFRETIEESMKIYNKGRPLSRQDYFVNYFLSLDAYGYFKDQQLYNLVDDAFHAYYGAHCEYYVTDDKNALEKSRAVYDEMNISTTICTSKDFITQFYKHNLLFNPPEKTILNRLSEEINNSLVLLSSVDNELNPVTVHEVKFPILNYFNRLQITKEPDSTCLYLYKKKSNYSHFMYWKEIKNLVQKITNEFGPDIHKLTAIQESDMDELSKTNWSGRYWHFDEVSISLTYDEEHSGLKLCCAISK